jgi:Major Facilitator Superfamily
MRARTATQAMFLMVGVLFGTWFGRVPQFRDGLALTGSELAVALIVPTIGALLSMQVAGQVIATHGSRRVLMVAGPALPLTLVWAVAAGDLTTALIALFVFGLVDGFVDVGMNAQGVAVERALGRPALSGMHAAWGVGAILAGLGGTAAVAAGLGLAQHVALLAVVLVPVAAVAGFTMLDDRAAPAVDEPAPARQNWRVGWSRRVLALGLIGGAAMLTEGAVSGWGAVYLQDELGATAALATFGYAVFTLAQTGTRMVGDAIRGRVRSVPLVRGTTLVAAAGLALALAAPGVVVGLVAMALLGIGLAVINPIVFSAVGHGVESTRDSASAIARYTTLTYGGILAGPAVIGWLADLTGLTVALACLFVPLAGIVLGAGLTRAAVAEGRPGTVEAG